MCTPAPLFHSSNTSNASFFRLLRRNLLGARLGGKIDGRGDETRVFVYGH